MPFINPIVFWSGLAAVSIPILIHLLNRRRFKIKDWAAMKFLLESIRKNRRRLRIEELILLALRCLAVLLLALVVARFTGCSSAQGARSDDGQGTSVFLLDDSLSMAHKPAGATLFDAARSDLAGEIGRLPPNNQVAVLPGSLTRIRLDPNRIRTPWLTRSFISEPRSLASNIRAQEPSDWRMDLAEALTAANDQFAGVTGPKKLYVLSDFRRVDLTGEEKITAIRQQFAELKKKGVEVVAMDYGRPAGHNLTVQEIRMLDKFAVAKAPIRIGVTVRNNGTSGESEVDVRPSARMAGAEGIQNVTLPVQVIHDLQAGQTASVEFQVVCQESGPAVITVTLPADELVEDNTASLALDVRKFIRVLVVDGARDVGDETESESYFFCRALDPKQDGSYGIRPDVYSPDGFASANLDEYDAIVMMNVARLPEDFRAASRPASASPTTARRPMSAAMEALEKYVREGGGLLVFSGPQMDVNYYNESFWANGAGLLPLRVGATITRGEANYVRLDPKQIATDRCLQTFQGEGARFTELVRFFKYLRADESSAISVGDAGSPRILAKFTDGEGTPAIAARTFGKGSVIMMYSGGSARWNDWPTDPTGTYALVMFDTVSDLARPQRPQTADVGQPIVVDVPRAWSGATAILRTPKYPKEEEIVLVRPAEDQSNLLKYEVPTCAGVYGLELKKTGGERMQIFQARNPEAIEGDLTPGGQATLTAALGSEDYLYRQVKGGDDPFGAVEAKAKNEYWKYALAALLLVLAVEVFLGQRFGHYTASSAAEQTKQQ